MKMFMTGMAGWPSCLLADDNVIIHGESKEEIPSHRGLDRLTKRFPLSIKKKCLTRNCGDRVVRFDEKKVVSRVLLPDGTGILFVQRKKGQAAKDRIVPRCPIVLGRALARGDECGKPLGPGGGTMQGKL